MATFEECWDNHDLELEAATREVIRAVKKQAIKRLARARDRIVVELHKERYERITALRGDGRLHAIRRELNESPLWDALIASFNGIRKIVVRIIRASMGDLFLTTANRYALALSECMNFDAEWDITLSKKEINSASGIIVFGKRWDHWLGNTIANNRDRAVDRLKAVTFRGSTLTELRTLIQDEWRRIRTGFLADLETGVIHILECVIAESLRLMNRTVAAFRFPKVEAAV